MQTVPSPVTDRGIELGIEVVRPPTLRAEDVQGTLASWRADAFIVAAYGLLLPGSVLEIPPLGCINVHFSLLPKLRGAAPVQWAIIEGMDTTGVTIMLMDEGLDTGPIYASREEAIDHDDTTGTLSDKLASVGAELLVDTLDRIVDGSLQPIPQDDESSTYAPKLGPADARIDWSLPGEAIRNRVRAFDPRPGAWTILNGKRVKVWKVALDGEPAGAPGSLRIKDGELAINAIDALMRIEQIQPEGRSRMAGGAFVRGYRPATGESAG